MSVTNNIVGATSVKLSEVAELLGEPNNLTACVLSDNINIWSKHKPCNGAWPIGSGNTRYALSYSVYPSASAVISATGNTFGYIHPYTTAPKRLGDFRNYNHNAQNPFGYTYYWQPRVRVLGRQRIQSMVPTVDTTYNLTIADIFPGANSWRYGIILYLKSNPSTYYILTNTEVIGPDSSGVNLEFTVPSTRATWCCIPILCNAQMNTLGGDPVVPADYIKVPDAPPIEFDVVLSAEIADCNVSVQGWYRQTTGEYALSILCSVDATATATTFSGGAQLLDPSGNIIDSLGSREVTVSPGETSVLLTASGRVNRGYSDVTVSGEVRTHGIPSHTFPLRHPLMLLEVPDDREVPDR